MPGADWENYFIKVSCLKVNNAYCGDKQNCRMTFANELTLLYLQYRKNLSMLLVCVYIDFMLLQRHNLTKPIADNVRAAQAEVTPSVTNCNLKILTVSLENIPDQIIHN